MSFLETTGLLVYLNLHISEAKVIEMTFASWVLGHCILGSLVILDLVSQSFKFFKLLST